MSKHKKKRSHEGMQENYNNMNMDSQNNTNEENTMFNNNMYTNGMNNNGMNNNRINNDGMNNNGINGNGTNSNSTNNNNSNPFNNGNHSNNRGTNYGNYNNMQQNPINLMLESLTRNPLLQIMSNIDFNLLAKLFGGNKEKTNEKSNIKTSKGYDQSLSQLLKNLDDNSVQELFRNIDMKEITILMSKLGTTKEDTLDKDNVEVSYTPNKPLENNDQESLVRGIYDDHGVIEINYTKYSATKVMNLIISLLNPNNLEFTDKVMSLYDEYYNEVDYSNVEVNGILEEEDKEEIEKVKEIEEIEEIEETEEKFEEQESIL